MHTSEGPEEKLKMGFHHCPVHHHWGELGAAGIVPWAKPDDDIYVLLGKRSQEVQHPGLWSSFGGAINDDEDAEDAALRELWEEIRGLSMVEMPDDEPSCVFTCPACGWTYTTFLARVAATKKLPLVEARNFETEEIHWLKLADVEKLNLHPGFASTWPLLRGKLLTPEVAARQEPA